MQLPFIDNMVTTWQFSPNELFPVEKSPLIVLIEFDYLFLGLFNLSFDFLVQWEVTFLGLAKTDSDQLNISPICLNFQNETIQTENLVSLFKMLQREILINLA